MTGGIFSFFSPTPGRPTAIDVATDGSFVEPQPGSVVGLLPPESSLSSHRYCRRVTRRSRSSFPLAFHVLPRPKRDAMTALYAFMRVTDDLADGPGEPAAKRAALAAWRDRLTAALDGRYTHRVHAVLDQVVRTYDIPARHLYDVLNGVETDLDPVSFATFDDLYPYCYRVASAVGLACLPVWGLRDPAAWPVARKYAEAVGIAFQLTNILRDLGEDRAAGRVYLPADELTRFGCPPGTWCEPTSREAFRAMMRFQVARAAGYYDRGAALGPLLSPEGRAIFGVMFGVYRQLLREIEARDYDVFTTRVRVGRLAKLRLMMTAWPRKWEWIT